jgi:hypothetical protein
MIPEPRVAAGRAAGEPQRTGETGPELNHHARYDSLVSAGTGQLAIEIAAEALPAGTHIVHVELADVSAHEGKDSWEVAIWFAGRFGAA